MEEKPKDETQEAVDSNELESPDNSSLESSSENSRPNNNADSSDDDKQSKAPQNDQLKPRGGKLKNLLAHVNIYLLGFILLLVLSGAGGGIYYLNGQEKPTEKQDSQDLSTDTLKQLANSGVTVGDSQQVLTVQSSTVFDGPVLLRDDVEIAGRLVVGGKLSLTGINVSGESTLQDLNVSGNLAVTGDTAVNGKVTIQDGLSVNSPANFSGKVSVGTLSVQSFKLTGAFTVTGHLIAGGSLPSRSGGPALGSGGTTSLSGSDTGGSIAINTGSSPGAGCFVTVNFTNNYNDSPHVIISPVGSAAGGLAYYVTRNTSSFSVCTASAPPAGRSFGFDYWVSG